MLKHLHHLWEHSDHGDLSETPCYLQFHFSWHVKELIEKMTVRREMDTGRLPTTLLDSQPRTLTPASPEPPVISGLRLTTTDEEWREAEVDKQTRELDASPLPSPFYEMPSGGDGSPPAARDRELASPSQS